ncbi:UbiX family flavin prenyltransferase [Natronospirillum operosum]|uniref:Flavin prenyltransferase UbiX n=1 Tax=Natronospirillum operosum TaxID=2759953 RepID=A0A4Z0WE60_9GAMM|nr:flavin prenyltransferase UbiX [Natronospirillum operosum]TGG94948.1 UbiX family flavin prenyltransferase [Natronospirillum operosum]
MTQQAIAIGITGASGAQYGLRLCEVLLRAGQPVYLMVSKAALMVTALETDDPLPARPEAIQQALNERWDIRTGLLQVFGREEWTAPVASGSGHWRALVVCPCSTGTLSAVATGASNNLIERCADVALKERRQVILVLRESPYSRVHIQNMLAATDAGAVVLPASPGFYHKPQTVDDMIDFIVARVLNVLDIPQSLLPAWGAGASSNEP